MSYAMNPTRRWEGVGGWLLVFVLVQIVALGFALFSVWQGTEARAALEGVRLDPELGLKGLLDFEINFHVARSIGIVLGLVLIALRWSATPLFWKIFLVASIVGLASDIVLSREMVAKLRPLLPAEGRTEFDRQTLQEFARSIGAILGALLWLLYWQFSKRVVNTYYHGGEEEPRLGSPGDLGSRTTGTPPQIYRAAQEVGLADRPTRDCPSCGTANLLAASHCRGCRAELEPAPSAGG